jgi:hypothetical protein
VASGGHPIEAAREALDIAARLLTGDPRGGVELLNGMGNERFDGLTEQELLRRATRELLIALIVVAEVFRLPAHMLVPKKIGETATLLRALGKAMSAATKSLAGGNCTPAHRIRGHLTDGSCGRSGRRPRGRCRRFQHVCLSASEIDSPDTEFVNALYANHPSGNP